MKNMRNGPHHGGHSTSFRLLRCIIISGRESEKGQLQPFGVPPNAANLRFTEPVHLPIVFFSDEGGLAMTNEVVVENTMARIRRVLSASWVALSVGWAAAAVAGPVEDLLNAAYRGDMAAVQALLNTGTDVNARTSEICRGSFTPVCGGATALIMASFTGHLDIVQALLAKGADVNAKMEDGATALGMATLAGSPFLLALGVAPAPDSCRPPS
jgi:hypothetical protein